MHQLYTYIQNIQKSRINKILKKLKQKKKESLLSRFFAQFQDFMILVLLAAAAISFFLSLFEGNADFADPDKVVNYKTTYERSLEAFSELREYAEKTGVSIGLENVWNKFLLSPMEMLDFINKIGSDYVGSYLDIGNTLLNGYPEDWVRILADKIKKVHFKDYRVEAGGLHGFVDLLAGDVNYPVQMAAVAIVSAPLFMVFLLLRKYIMQGVSRSGIKG